MVIYLMFGGRPIQVGINDKCQIWARYRDKDRMFLTRTQILSLVQGE